MGAALQVFGRLVSLRRSQWWDPARTRQLKERKLRKLVRHAYESVPFYRERFDRAGVRPETIRHLEDLERLPVVGKRDLQVAGKDAIVSSRCRADGLIEVRTSGSTGQPFTIYWDRHWDATQRALFFRALASTGYRFGDKVAILTENVESRRTPRWMNWHYVSYNDDPARILSVLKALRPKVLYGWVTPLRRLALHAQEQGGAIHRPEIVITTAEALDGQTRSLLRAVFAVEPFEFYGLSEMGWVATECPHHDGLHFSEDTLIAESPDAGAGVGHSRLVLTNLDLYGMPLIRYETGDLVAWQADGPCRCGRRSRRIVAVQGRSVDCIKLPGGTTLLPYDLTRAIELVDGIGRYRVVQRGLQAFEVYYEGPKGDDATRRQGISDAMAGVLGDQARVELFRSDNLDPPSGRKFRVVESLVD